MIKWIIKSGSLFQLILLAVLATVFWIPAFVNPPQIIHTAFDGVLYPLLTKWLVNSPIFTVTLALMLVLGQAIAFSLILQWQGVFHRANYFPSIVVLLCYSWNVDYMTIHPMLFAGVFILISMNFLLSLYLNNHAFQEVLTASMAIGLASLLFYIPLLYLIMAVWFAFIALRISEWREYVISVIGVVVPYLYYLVWLFLNDNFIQGVLQLKEVLVNIQIPESIAIPHTIWLFACAFVFVVAILNISVNLNDKVLLIRRKTWVIFNFIIPSLVALLIIGWPIYPGNYIFVFPFAFYVTAAIIYNKNSIYIDILLVSLFLLLVVQKAWSFIVL